MTDSDNLRACLRLSLAEGLGPVLFRRLIDAFGSPEEVIAAGPGRWRGVEGFGSKLVAAMSAVTDEQVADELAAAEAGGASVICYCDDDYPRALKTIASRPAVLYVRGRLEPTDAVAIGVVGARRCTHYGLEQAERFGELLGRAGFTVVSGGARGIDTAAHRGALAAGGRTVAVMGCGLATCYPRENEKLFVGIVDEGRGAMVSELPMATGVQGRNFPRRNRIISGLSLGVLVVEAARRSGALITATEAAEQGREVFAVPGRVDSAMSEGTNQLLRDGAVLTSSLDDILGQLGEIGEKMTPEARHEDGLARPVGLSHTETRLLDALQDEPLSVDQLVRVTGLSSGEAISAMTMLVLKGAVEQRPGNVFARKTRDTRSSGE